MEKQPEKKETVFIYVANLSKEEREEWKKNLPQKALEAIEQQEKEGIFERCPKTDWCAKFNEEKIRKEKEQKEKNDKLEARLNEQAILIAELSKKVFG